ncbi:MAG: nickel pincer cofactor biosynthesis protein LarB [Bacillota bacterium]
MDDVLMALVRGEIDLETARARLQVLNIRRVGEIARLDVNRTRRTGVPEAILAQGKRPEDVRRLALAMAAESGYAYVTRADAAAVRALARDIPQGLAMSHNGLARTVLLKNKDFTFPRSGRIGVLAAGTADVGVAEEVVETAHVMGCEALKAYDVGVAGIHRLYEPLGDMVDRRVAAIVVVAGMDAVLPIVVSSQVAVPVIGLPTSVGYGMGKEGVAGLMTMLQTCTPGLAVVNIDNGFGAGVFASLIARQSAQC